MEVGVGVGVEEEEREKDHWTSYSRRCSSLDTLLPWRSNGLFRNLNPTGFQFFHPRIWTVFLEISLYGLASNSSSA